MVLMAFDAIVLALAYAGFAWLRYMGPITAEVPWRSVGLVAGTAIVVQLLGGWALMTYRGRDAVGSTDETVNLASLGLVATVAAHLTNVLGPLDLVGRTVPWGAGLAGVAMAEGDPARAVYLLGAAQAINDRMGAVWEPEDHPEYARHQVAVRAALGEEAFAAAWAAGYALSLEDAIERALAGP